MSLKLFRLIYKILCTSAKIRDFSKEGEELNLDKKARLMTLKMQLLPWRIAPQQSLSVNTTDLIENHSETTTCFTSSKGKSLFCY